MKNLLKNRIEELNTQASEIEQRLEGITDLESDEYKEAEVEEIANNGAIGEANYLLSQVENNTILKDIMLESEMVKYLIENGHDIYDEEPSVDSVAVADIACDELGYEGYMIHGSGNLDQTLIFVKTKEL